MTIDGLNALELLKRGQLAYMTLLLLNGPPKGVEIDKEIEECEKMIENLDHNIKRIKEKQQ